MAKHSWWIAFRKHRTENRLAVLNLHETIIIDYCQSAIKLTTVDFCECQFQSISIFNNLLLWLLLILIDYWFTCIIRIHLPCKQKGRLHLDFHDINFQGFFFFTFFILNSWWHEKRKWLLYYKKKNKRILQIFKFKK